MGRTRRLSKNREVNPTFFVFCEGETEEAYVKLLRSLYRLPIEIIPKISDSNISEKYIQSCKKQYVLHDKDMTFLMFDLDVAGMFERLSSIPDAILLCSNPCFELWLLLHYTEHKNTVSSPVCIHKLMDHESHYTKGSIIHSLHTHLIENRMLAVEKAKQLILYKNRSTSVYRFIEELEKIKIE